MKPNDKACVVDVLARFADDVEKLPALDPFFIARLERALAAVLEGRLKTIS